MEETYVVEALRTCLIAYYIQLYRFSFFFVNCFLSSMR